MENYKEKTNELEQRIDIIERLQGPPVSSYLGSIKDYIDLGLDKIRAEIKNGIRKKK